MEQFSGDFGAKCWTTITLTALRVLTTSCSGCAASTYIFHFPTVIPKLTETGKMPKNPVNVLVLMQAAIRRGLELTVPMTETPTPSLTRPSG